jgi:hypothetical protein
MVIAFSGGTSTLLICYGVEFPYGNFYFSLYAFIMTYAIVAHRLMDIEVIIKKTVVFAGLFAMVMAVVMVVTTVAQGVVSRYIGVPVFVTTAFSVMIAILLYDPTRKLLVHVTDRFLFQKKFRLTSIIAQASEAIALVQSLKWLARRIAAFLVIKCRIRNAAIYVRSEDGREFRRLAVRGYGAGARLPELLDSLHPMIRVLEAWRRPVELQSLEDRSAQAGGEEEKRKGLAQAAAFLKSAQSEAVIPSFLKRRVEAAGMGKEQMRGEEETTLRNILILGPKKSDEPYTEEDLEMFFTLAQESAIAIENARLYDEAVKRMHQLAETIRVDMGQAAWAV